MLRGSLKMQAVRYRRLPALRCVSDHNVATLRGGRLLDDVLLVSASDLSYLSDVEPQGLVLSL